MEVARDAPREALAVTFSSVVPLGDTSPVLRFRATAPSLTPCVARAARDWSARAWQDGWLRARRGKRRAVVGVQARA